MKGGPLETLKTIEKSLTKPEKGIESLIMQKNKNRETPQTWNHFVSHARGFRCVQNQVLSTYGKNAKCTKSGPIALN